MRSEARTDEFFALARERYLIQQRRLDGNPWPWSEDTILSNWKFCNVHREHDRNTLWFREHVREPLRNRPEVLLATVVFRLLNRITSGEAVFLQRNIYGETAFEEFARTLEARTLRRAILSYVGPGGPYVTGAYIIKTPAGVSKLDGVMWILEQFANGEHPVPNSGYSTPVNWRDMEDILQSNTSWSGIPGSQIGLQMTHDWLEQFPFIGHFTAYEVVSDLRWTDLLNSAPDILTWANPGPGATRGLNYIHGRDTGRTPPVTQRISEMQELLTLARDPSSGQWPAGWREWEMREVEHWLCEAFKYWRFRDGGPAPRGRFRP